MNDLQQILKDLGEVQAVLNSNNYPGENPSALAKIQFLTARLKGTDAYISEKAGRLASQAGLFYSARKHLKYPGGSDRLYAELTFDLPGRIQSQVETLARLRNIQSDDQP